MMDPDQNKKSLLILEKALRESESRFSAIASITADAVIMVDETQNIIFFNKGAEHIFGYPSSEVIGRPLDLLMPNRFAQPHRKQIEGFGAEAAPSRFMHERKPKIYGRRRDGSEFPAEASISKSKKNGQTFFTAVLRDISKRIEADLERKRFEEKVQRLAYYDTLTSFPNRHLFHDLLEKGIFQGQRDGRPGAILLLDLDRFKEINDTLGHHRGDLLLQKVGLRLKEALFTKDTVARLGGDEFGILLSMASSDHAGLVANKILKALEEPFEVEGLPVVVETSIGIALYPDHGSNADSLIQRGDVAMYASKKEKIDFVVYNSELDQHSPGRLALMGELRHAIENRQLFLHYQPIIDLQTRRICGVEALVRWNHPKQGIVPPDQFILPAEHTGLIKTLTKFVLQEAIQQSLSWTREGKKISLAVNLSVRNLQDPLLPSQMIQMIRSLGIEPGLLNFEITESAIMTNIESVIKTIRLLNHEGVNFSIDDFGIGYTSLSYLKKLAVKSIKIDRSFIKNMLRDQEDHLIVRSTIDLAHSLNLRVIAEGVEDQETLEKLITLGCDEAQGYFISRPVPAEDLLRWNSESPWGLG
ncbi:MAG: EAL domain-containing protein [Nitrospirae bacterium]|nr:EAL domain-containing protein [Nitrospirota bacterium]MBI3352055.1 EAL domain-containing protein [Nitrospirota bacterium]